MKRFFKDTAILGKIAFTILLLATIVDIFMQGGFFPLLALDTSLTSRGEELWRLITYPFVMDDVASLFLFIAVFIFWLPQLRGNIPKQIVAPLSLILVLMQSVMVTLLFWETKFIYSGLEGISLFYLFLAVLMVPKSRVFILGKYIGRSLNFGVFVLLGWIGFNLLTLEMQGNTITQGGVAPFIALIFGLVTSLSVYGNIRLVNSLAQRRLSNSENAPRTTSAMMKKVYAQNIASESVLQQKSQPEKEEDEEAESLVTQINASSAFTSSDEDVLNSLLDKINIHGEKSLSDDERQSLLILSKKID